MALPLEKQSTRSKEDNPPTTQPKLSYANAVKKTTDRQSLIHDNVVVRPTTTTPPPSEGGVRVVQSRIYRSARSKGAFLFDTTEVLSQYTEQEIYLVIVKQHPNCHSAAALKDGPRFYMEVYIDREDDNNDIARTGLLFDKLNLKVLPCLPVHESAKVINVTLSRLPYGKKEKVLQGLKATLSPFGKIMDLGIFVDTESRLFLGRGYAILDIGSDQPDTYQDLTHVIEWKGPSHSACRATWKNMPTWCRYCHQEGHAIADCEQAKVGILCFHCQQRGHRARECPDKKRKGKNPSKRPRVIDPTPPSKELLKSKHAPTPVPVVTNANEPSEVATKKTSAPVAVSVPTEGESKDIEQEVSMKEPEKEDQSAHMKKMEEDMIDSSGEEDPDYVAPVEDSDEELPEVEDTDEEMEAGIIDEDMDELQDLREEQEEHDNQALQSNQAGQQSSSPTNRYKVLVENSKKGKEPNMGQLHAQLNNKNVVSKEEGGSAHSQ